MGLFDKKYCDVCGDKIGLLGNRKLEDGNLCKACAAKLSPWFSERKSSTVAEIKDQLEYREANRDAVAAFNTTRTLGTNVKVLLDENRQKFMVTGARNLQEANPDVFDYSQITGCRLDIQESRTEMKYRAPDGKDISYSPAQYKLSYSFYMVINVNCPYFNEIRFLLNNTSVYVEPVIRLAPMSPFVPGRPAAPAAAAAAAARPGIQRPGAPARPAAQPARPAAQPARSAAAPAPAYPSPRVMSSTPADPRTNPDYIRFQQMGEDIIAALTKVQEEAVPQQAVTCPWCGATTLPDANGCCEYCGGSLNG